MHIVFDARPFGKTPLRDRDEFTTEIDPDCIIIGVGNLQRGDDGAGIAALARLRRRRLPPSIRTADIGTDGFAMIQQMGLARRAVILDAVAMNRPPGTIRMFSPEEIGGTPSMRPLSVHSFNLAHVLTIAARLGVKPEIRLLGIQPENMDFGDPLSPPVRAAIPRFAETALQCAIEPSENSPSWIADKKRTAPHGSGEPSVCGGFFF